MRTDREILELINSDVCFSKIKEYLRVPVKRICKVYYEMYRNSKSPFHCDEPRHYWKTEEEMEFQEYTYVTLSQSEKEIYNKSVAFN